ncbi:hypothetical protein OKW39_001914 [Paraburkholderia sp. MM6662-R1]
MPAHRMNMRMIKDVLRLKFDGGFSHDRIAASLGISKGVVTKYLGLAGAAGLDWASACDMDEGELERRLLGKPTGPPITADCDHRHGTPPWLGFRASSKPAQASTNDSHSRSFWWNCFPVTAQANGARSPSGIAQLAPRGSIIDAELPTDQRSTLTSLPSPKTEPKPPRNDSDTRSCQPESWSSGVMRFWHRSQVQAATS